MRIELSGSEICALLGLVNAELEKVRTVGLGELRRMVCLRHEESDE